MKSHEMLVTGQIFSHIYLDIIIITFYSYEVNAAERK